MSEIYNNEDRFILNHKFIDRHQAKQVLSVECHFIGQTEQNTKQLQYCTLSDAEKQPNAENVHAAYNKPA